MPFCRQPSFLTKTTANSRLLHDHVAHSLRPPGRRDHMTTLALLLQQATKHDGKITITIIGIIPGFCQQKEPRLFQDTAEAGHFADNRHILHIGSNDDRLHAGIFRLQTNAIPFMEKALQGRLTIDQDHHYFTILRR
jgi:hypothetical protein